MNKLGMTEEQLQSQLNMMKSGHELVMRAYNELRDHYYEQTGLSFVPSVVSDTVVVTDEDKEYLRKMGIDFGEETSAR